MLLGRQLVSGALTLLAACAPISPPPTPAPRPEAPALDPTAAQRLITAGRLYWRRGETCEPWSIHLDDHDTTRGRIEHPVDGARFAFAFTAARHPGHITLEAPRYEAEDRDTALPCTYDGEIERRPGAPPQITLHTHERWYTELDACERGAPPTLRPLGCASALADPRTRARLRGHERLTLRPHAPDFLERSARARALYWLDRGPEGPRCERWSRRRPDRSRSHEARLQRRIGERLVVFEYALDGAWLTLAGPVWTDPQRPDRLGARSCLTSRVITDASAERLTFEGGAWYLRRRACEAARARAVSAELSPPPCLDRAGLTTPDGSGTARAPAPPA